MHLFESKLINIDEIEVTERVRKELGDIDELSRSLSTEGEGVGLIQQIAVMRKVDPALAQPNKPYLLLAGERRYRALKKANATEIPVNVFPHTLTTLQKKRVEGFENLYRKGFTPAEEARMTEDFHTVMQDTYGDPRARGADGEGWRLKDTAEFMGISIAKVDGDLKIAEAVRLIPELARETTRAAITKKVKGILKEAIRAEAAEKAITKLPSSEVERKQKLIDSYVVCDTFELAAKIGAGVIHFSEVDPPYGIGMNEQKGDPDYKEIPANDYPAFIKRLTEMLFHIHAPNSALVFWHDPSWEGMVKEMLELAGWRVKRTRGVWLKNEAKNDAPEWNLSQYYEQFYVAVKGSPPLQSPGHTAVFKYDCIPSQLKIHPTERPIELIEEIYHTFCLPGMRVYVPFLGSGKSLLAAANKNLIAVGAEISPEWKLPFTRMVQEQIWGQFTDNEN